MIRYETKCSHKKQPGNLICHTKPQTEKKKEKETTNKNRYNSEENPYFCGF